MGFQETMLGEALCVDSTSLENYRCVIYVEWIQLVTILILPRPFLDIRLWAQFHLLFQ